MFNLICPFRFGSYRTEYTYNLLTVFHRVKVF
jgi:hypothetical protein